jgi:hypothetical protein
MDYLVPQMFPPVNTRDPVAVEVEAQAAQAAMFPGGDRLFVPRAFGWAINAFSGNQPGFLPVDVAYHDLEHTMQGTLCMVRLLRSRHAAGAQPQIPERFFQLGILAILLHDTGYLKRREDKEGTGAKYTATHVRRSAEFAAALMGEKEFPAEDIQAVQNMIYCTGVDAALGAISFQGEAERIVGQALGTADLLGQMAAEDYVGKLPMLYAEFAEAASHSKERGHFGSLFSSAQDLLQKTPAFWEYTKVRLNRDFGGLYRFLNDPYPYGPNHYLERIEANIARIQSHLTPPAPGG